ncbi:alpha/beta fold hydrolase [Streptomyces mayteni]
MTHLPWRGYVPSPFGQLHYAECGTGEPVLMLHQTPCSWTEFLDVLPLVGAAHRAIAMDTLGFDASARPARPHSIERYADAAGALVDALTVLDQVTEGHEAVRRYRMEDRLPQVTARTLAVCAPGDHHALPSLGRLAAALGCPTRLLSGGHVPAPEQKPGEFARVVSDWVARG